MNRSAEEFVKGLQYIENAVYIHRTC